MRSCASVLSLFLALGGCTEPTGAYGFRIDAVQLRPGYQQIGAAFNQQLRLSGEAVQALQNGVPLTVRLDMELRDSDTLTRLADDSHRFEIRYLPLSQHYQLTGPVAERVRTFPRLRHVLAALSSVELTLGTGALAPGRYELRTRTSLENSRLPAPMRLPALFSKQWRHDTEWSTWPFEISV